eukprot:SAG22_NODE_1657_length_3885_cov_6.187005_3_plen_640_part_00
METGFGPPQLSPLSPAPIPGSTEQQLDALESMVAMRSPKSAAGAGRALPMSAPPPLAAISESEEDAGAGPMAPPPAAATGTGPPLSRSPMSPQAYLQMSGGRRRGSVSMAIGANTASSRIRMPGLATQADQPGQPGHAGQAAKKLKRAASKTAVFSMQALTQMAAKQEQPAKEQTDHGDSGLEYWQYDGGQIDSRKVSVLQSGQFLAELVATCNGEFEEREARSRDGAGGGGRVDDLESQSSCGDQESNEQHCRWIHMRGINFGMMDAIGQSFNLAPELIDECKAVASKPSVSWQQPSDDMRFDHLFIVAHYLHLVGDDDSSESDAEVQAFDYEQVSFIYMPEYNLLMSIDGNGQKSLDAVVALLYNRRSPVRKGQEAAMLLFAVIDSMLDEVYPLLDLYGDALEGLEFMMMKSEEPTMQHVGFSYKIKRLIHSLRRYAWDTRQLMQELRQNQYGVMPQRAAKLMGSVEQNADNMVEVAEAYMEQCKGAAEFFESFQEKVVAGTLYILTIASVTIMPAQLLTGLFGMNFVGSGDSGGMAELEWQYGYPLFWGLVGALTCTALGCMYRKGILKKRETNWSAAIRDDEEVKDSEKEKLKREQSRARLKSGKSLNLSFAVANMPSKELTSMTASTPYEVVEA